jgi:aminoglycoside phosphotransferase (APT) family kinase protein
MLTERGVVDFLLEHGLVSPERVVAGDLSVRDVSRRNRNYKVVSRDGPSYLVKQGFGAEGRTTVAHEAHVYQLLAEETRTLGRFVPAYYGYEPEHALLVIELVSGARTLLEHQSNGRFSVTLARSLGRALGTLHRESAGASPGNGALPAGPPFALWIHRPTVSMLRDVSEANVALIRSLQGAPGLEDLLEELRMDWRPACITHNDYKADNCVVVRGRDGRGTGVRLVDWEIGGPGDPAWDAGSVLGDYLSAWLSSIPITGTDPPERFAEIARFPLSRMRPALGAFWESYSKHAALDATASDRLLVRAARFSAARLIQSAFEQTQHTSVLTGTTLCLVQVAVNVLRRPHEAAVRLMGIPLRGRGAP